MRAFERGIETVALGSIAVGLAVLALKAAAAHLTGSAAFFSDALETVVNVAASVIAWIALRFAALPPDANHPYGHDKAEFLAAVVEGVLIVVAALSIFERAWSSWSNPHPLAAPLTGMALNGASAVLNLAWAAVLLRTARRHRSPALQADGRHLLADVVTSLGILAGVTLVLLTGNLRIDAIVAALTGIYVLLSGMHLIQGSVAGLMDAAPDDATLARIRALVSANAGGAIEAHDLRTRRAGRINFLQFHLVVPGSMTVSESHAICDRIEAALEADMAHLVVNIHVEPEEKAKQHGVPVL